MVQKMCFSVFFACFGGKKLDFELKLACGATKMITMGLGGHVQAPMGSKYFFYGLSQNIQHLTLDSVCGAAPKPPMGRVLWRTGMWRPWACCGAAAMGAK